MTKLKFVLIGLFALGSLPAFACDDVCKDSEYYSDEAEMCLVKPAV